MRWGLGRPCRWVQSKIWPHSLPCGNCKLASMLIFVHFCVKATAHCLSFCQALIILDSRQQAQKTYQRALCLSTYTKRVPTLSFHTQASASSCIAAAAALNNKIWLLLQTISFLAHLHLDRGIAGPSLVVCPLSVISSWMAEFQRWCPSLRVVRIHSSDPHERARIRHEVGMPALYVCL